MAEYIEREALIDAVESIDWYSVYKGKLTAGAPNTENALYKANEIYSAIDNAPAVDVVTVVRCKDCKHHYWEQEPCHGKSVHYCALPHMRGIKVFKEFFCYYGERKDGDGNG